VSPGFGRLGNPVVGWLEQDRAVFQMARSFHTEIHKQAYFNSNLSDF
jgi:hypothetical protein